MNTGPRYVDDTAVAKDTTQPIRVSVGTHRVRIEASGTLLFSRTVTIVPGEQTIDMDGNQR